VRIRFVAWTLGGVTLLFGCTAAPSTFNWTAPLGLDEFIAVPESNPLTPRKIALGERLFFDRALSSDGSIACASCHRPEHAFSDTSAVSTGVGARRGRRNSPTLLNRGYGRSLFWDGRVVSLEEQVLHPIQDSLEMDLPLQELVNRLRDDQFYRAEFRRVFQDGVTSGNVARALASYLRTLRSGGAPIDRYRHGDSTALSAAAQRGLTLFLGRASCAACHAGPNFTDEQFHNTGVAWRRGSPTDSGRAAVTRAAQDVGAFKTPTLRDVACTAPYMHDGSLRTLDDVIDFYDRGGHANANLDGEIQPLRLDAEEKRSLVVLLSALGEDCRRVRPIGSRASR
jgi:cytochrome c peroxidase